MHMYRGREGGWGRMGIERGEGKGEGVERRGGEGEGKGGEREGEGGRRRGEDSVHIV